MANPRREPYSERRLVAMIEGAVRRVLKAEIAAMQLAFALHVKRLEYKLSGNGGRAEEEEKAS